MKEPAVKTKMKDIMNDKTTDKQTKNEKIKVLMVDTIGDLRTQYLASNYYTVKQQNKPKRGRRRGRTAADYEKTGGILSQTYVDTDFKNSMKDEEEVHNLIIFIFYL